MGISKCLNAGYIKKTELRTSLPVRYIVYFYSKFKLKFNLILNFCESIDSFEVRQCLIDKGRSVGVNGKLSKMQAQ